MKKLPGDTVPHSMVKKEEQESLEARIKKLAAAYLRSPSAETAAKLADAVYPTLFWAAFEIGGTFEEISASTLAALRAYFQKLQDPSVLEDQSVASLYRLTFSVAASRAIDHERQPNRPSSPGTEASRSNEDLLEVGKTSPTPLNESARRGVAILKKAAGDPSRCLSLAPAVREALGSLPARYRVAVRIYLLSPSPFSEVPHELLDASGEAIKGPSTVAALASAAAVALFEHIGRVVDDE
ncbi:MAG: hypothetical protein C4318_01105 [Acidimicrobiia bacterium]